MPKKKTTEAKEKPVEKVAKQKKLSQPDYEKKVIELAEGGMTSEKIGEELRRQGSHPQEYNKKISEILREKNLYQDPELKNIEKKLAGVEKHYDKNHQDKRAKREKDRLFSHLRKIKKYLGVEIVKKKKKKK
ncbi:hypothetical protein J4481_02445 [Candidatus Pacearchaeota archaeon]|nr:hypothetical protein [Candidatus Pacearchaeota archaeon]